MPEIVVQPIVLRDSLITLGANDYQSSCSGCTFTPSNSYVNFQGMSPTAGFTFPGVTTWVAQLDYAQDWATADSLARYLHEHEGESVPIIFEPVNGDPAVTATVVIAPGAIGGAVNTVAVGSVQLGVSGKPTVAPIV